MTHGIELVDCCDEFAHLVSDNTGQVDERSLWNTRAIMVMAYSYRQYKE